MINWKLFTTERRSTKQSRLGFGTDSVLIKKRSINSFDSNVRKGV
jgi:hypothetical protein